MKSIATRKKATEIRFCERSSSGMPDSTVVPLITAAALIAHQPAEQMGAR